MVHRHLRLYFITAFCLLWAEAGVTAEERSSISENTEQTRSWNRFAGSLYDLHKHLTERRKVHMEEETGGYGGHLGGRDFYKEIKYYDSKNRRLLSRIRWERAPPARIHTIEVFIYDESGRLIRDYVAAYLPRFRHAPYQTLVNFHHYDDDLHGFRQFDASDIRIYEQCRGRFFGEAIDISFEEYEIPDHASLIADAVIREAYTACFSGMPASAAPYLDPLAELPGSADVDPPDAKNPRSTDADIDRLIQRYTRAIAAAPTDAQLYLKRGDAFFLIHEFDKAIEDFTATIKHDKKLDEAYFGRGMAYGRAGELDKAIADLTVYIERRPTSSLAYTKRGVRYIWKGDLRKAKQDLLRAVALDATNAEAHDDLGVVYAQEKHYAPAIGHFQSSIRHDPTYQKAYHNLAIIYYLTERGELALQAVDEALALSPENRNSLLLKSAVLASLGRDQEAKAIKDNAEFLPEGNWTEQFAIQ